MAGTVLQRIAEGDRSAVGNCVSSYGGLIWVWARKALPNVNEAENAVREIFIEIWKAAARFDQTRSSERDYVALIARGCLIDRLREKTNKTGR